VPDVFGPSPLIYRSGTALAAPISAIRQLRHRQWRRITLRGYWWKGEAPTRGVCLRTAFHFGAAARACYCRRQALVCRFLQNAWRSALWLLRSTRRGRGSAVVTRLPMSSRATAVTSSTARFEGGFVCLRGFGEAGEFAANCSDAAGLRRRWRRFEVEERADVTAHAGSIASFSLAVEG